MLKNILLPKSYCLVPGHEERIQKEVISISLYTVEVLMTFIGMLREKIHSLLMFDIVQADAPISDELKEEIEKDGVVIYEKV